MYYIIYVFLCILKRMFFDAAYLYYIVCIFFRTYTPYVFQPNFLKQMRPRRGMSGPGMGLPLSGANSMQLNDAGKFTQHSSQHPMPNNSGMMSSGGGNMSISATNYDDSQRKKSGRRVIDWTSSCALYLEVDKVLGVGLFIQ